MARHVVEIRENAIHQSEIDLSKTQRIDAAEIDAPTVNRTRIGGQARGFKELGQVRHRQQSRLRMVRPQQLARPF